MERWFSSIRESGFVKGMVYMLIGVVSYPGLNIINRLSVKGMENLHKLPKSNVLFVSNHQTYFADVITFLHIFCAVKWGKKKGLGIPYYLIWPFTRVKYVAAEETMKSNWMSRLFSLAGAITVRRTWNSDSSLKRKGLDPGDTRKIARALEKNWVITFPQGTTTPFAPGRKGTAFIIKQYQPIVIPVVISGFSTAFNKKGLRLKKKGTPLSVIFNEPLQINYDLPVEKILAQLMEAIEQTSNYQPQTSNPI